MAREIQIAPDPGEFTSYLDRFAAEVLPSF